jgi:hypothetical protein
MREQMHKGIKQDCNLVITYLKFMVRFKVRPLSMCISQLSVTTTKYLRRLTYKNKSYFGSYIWESKISLVL